MMTEKLQAAFNNQVNEELFSAYLYASMSCYFELQNLKGFAHWMQIQTQEEMAHAAKFINFLLDRGVQVKLREIAAPDSSWASPLAAFEAAYKHECHISECMNKLSSLAVDEKDHASRIFLEWFVTEQVEEEANADNMVQQLKRVADAPAGLFMLDREASQRPAPTAATTAP